MACACCDDRGLVDGVGVCPLCDGLGSAGWSDTLGFKSSGELPYKVVQLAGKGFGVCATRNIEKGSLIIAEQPLLSIPGVEGIRSSIAEEHATLHESLDTADMRQENVFAAHDMRVARAVGSALARLPVREQNGFLALSDGFGDVYREDHVLRSMRLKPGVWVEVRRADDDGPGDGAPFAQTRGLVISESERSPKCFSLETSGGALDAITADRLTVLGSGHVGGIFMTNAVSAAENDVAHCHLRTSRFNHSCAPKANVIKADGARVVYAVSNIQAGEEICIPYIEDYAVSEEHRDLCKSVQGVAPALGLDPDLLLAGLHRQQLFAKWGFWCSCSRCSSVSSEADAALSRWCEKFRNVDQYADFAGGATTFARGSCNDDAAIVSAESAAGGGLSGASETDGGDVESESSFHCKAEVVGHEVVGEDGWTIIS